MESVTTDKPDASRASDDKHLGSSSATNGFSVIHKQAELSNVSVCDSLLVGSLSDSLS